MRLEVVLILLFTVGALSLRRWKRNLFQFRQMIKCTIPGSNPTRQFNDYGCHCGYGGSGAPVDDLDRCCQVHDICYRDLKKGEDCNSIFDHPFMEVYAYSCDNNAVTCTGANNPCEMHICECDRRAAVCFSNAAYNETHKSLDVDIHCH
ncbi:phospholipase A2, minor isoenzyme-like [Discoglossus pictus]